MRKFYLRIRYYAPDFIECEPNHLMRGVLLCGTSYLNSSIVYKELRVKRKL